MRENFNMESPLPPDGSVTDWEARYVASDTPWDKGAAHPHLVTFLHREPSAGKILVPGCGLGSDARALSTNPQASVLGLDLSPFAIEAAKRLNTRPHLHFEVGDFLNPAPSLLETFDFIFEHTCFCAIPIRQREAYAKAATDWLKPAGRLIAIFYLDPGHPQSEGPPFGTTRAELDGLFLPTFTLVHEETNLETFHGREGRELFWILEKKPTPQA